MPKFPVDAPIRKVLKTLGKLGFSITGEKERISMVRENSDGTKTPLTIPNHSIIKGSALRSICSQSKITRDDFIKTYNES